MLAANDSGISNAFRMPSRVASEPFPPPSGGRSAAKPPLSPQTPSRPIFEPPLAFRSRPTPKSEFLSI